MFAIYSAMPLLQPLRWRCVECAIHHERDEPIQALSPAQMYPQQRLSAVTPDIANLVAVQMGRPVCPTAHFEQQLPRNEPNCRGLKDNS